MLTMAIAPTSEKYLFSGFVRHQRRRKKQQEQLLTQQQQQQGVLSAGLKGFRQTSLSAGALQKQVPVEAGPIESDMRDTGIVDVLQYVDKMISSRTDSKTTAVVADRSASATYKYCRSKTVSDDTWKPKTVESMHLGDMYVDDGDDCSLPVVELRPFTTGEWQKSRSYSAAVRKSRNSLSASDTVRCGRSAKTIFHIHPSQVFTQSNTTPVVRPAPSTQTTPLPTNRVTKSVIKTAPVATTSRTVDQTTEKQTDDVISGRKKTQRHTTADQTIHDVRPPSAIETEIIVETSVDRGHIDVKSLPQQETEASGEHDVVTIYQDDFTESVERPPSPTYGISSADDKKSQRQVNTTSKKKKGVGVNDLSNHQAANSGSAVQCEQQSRRRRGGLKLGTRWLGGKINSISTASVENGKKNRDSSQSQDRVGDRPQDVVARDQTVSIGEAVKDELIYDAFDRQRTLTSITIQPLTQILTAHIDATVPDNDIRSVVPSTERRQQRDSRIIVNSLDLLTSSSKKVPAAGRRKAAVVPGAVTGLEVGLNDELRSTIGRLRRTRTTTAVRDGMGRAFVRRCDVTQRPTFGEARLMSASRRSRRPPPTRSPTYWTDSWRRLRPTTGGIVDNTPDPHCDVFYLPQFFSCSDVGDDVSSPSEAGSPDFGRTVNTPATISYGALTRGRGTSAQKNPGSSADEACTVTKVIDNAANGKQTLAYQTPVADEPLGGAKTAADVVGMDDPLDEKSFKRNNFDVRQPDLEHVVDGDGDEISPMKSNNREKSSIRVTTDEEFVDDITDFPTASPTYSSSPEAVRRSPSALSSSVEESVLSLADDVSSLYAFDGDSNELPLSTGSNLHPVFVTQKPQENV